MASSAFSFHCMICFEEFDTHTNYPVVLPCGHTYVCIECANRLDKCMECREPLTMKCEPAPSPSAPGSGSSRAIGPDSQKENVNYADRVRNSPGFRSRYGYRNEYSNNSNNNNNNRVNGINKRAGPSPPPPQPVRLPLPKNAVLLSLIQASEPARRSAEIDAPCTSQKTDDRDDHASRDGLSTPSRRPIRLPRTSSSSPLLLGGSPFGGHPCNESSMSNLVGSVPDDEDHKIRVGTYLEGGPCGTYAVAVKTGLLVYPTLFERTLPGALNGLRHEEEDEVKRDVDELVNKHRANVGMPSFDDMAALALVASEDNSDDDEIHSLTASLIISMDEDDEDGGNELVAAGARILPVRRTQSIHGIAVPPEMSLPLLDVTEDDPASQQLMTKKLSRHFSQGSYPKPPPENNMGSQKNQNATVDEFDRPLVRLKYGDRVQVVSMDKRGWVKLARGYGYIRLENDKQLVKVGGTSDKACQIEAMLHELSMERNRLKQEQTKLERLSAGLMIDLQSSLITSADDQVVVSAPEGSLRRRSNSESDLSLDGGGRQLDASNSSVTSDDIDASNRSRSLLSPRSSTDHDDDDEPARPAHQEIRTTQSHSPGRVPNPDAPPSPAHGQGSSNIQRSWSSVSNSPMRVNFRTGMSGHRALTSSHSHPHDFLESQRGHRSMSNHAGISMNSYLIPDAFWESPCAGGA